MEAIVNLYKPPHLISALLVLGICISCLHYSGFIPVANAQEQQREKINDAGAEYVTSTALLSGEALFSLDSRVLTERGIDALLKLINDLHDYDEIVAIKVTGHTDSSGPDEYNRQLSGARARHVASFFKQTFPDVPVSASGMGEALPLVSNETLQGRQRNRRVEVEVIAQAVRE